MTEYVCPNCGKRWWQENRFDPESCIYCQAICRPILTDRELLIEFMALIEPMHAFEQQSVKTGIPMLGYTVPTFYVQKFSALFVKLKQHIQQGDELTEAQELLLGMVEQHCSDRNERIFSGFIGINAEAIVYFGRVGLLTVTNDDGGRVVEATRSGSTSVADTLDTTKPESLPERIPPLLSPPEQS